MRKSAHAVTVVTFLKRVRWPLRFGISLCHAVPRPSPKQRSANLPRWWPEKIPGLLALGFVSCPCRPLLISSHPERRLETNIRPQGTSWSGSHSGDKQEEPNIKPHTSQRNPTRHDRWFYGQSPHPLGRFLRPVTTVPKFPRCTLASEAPGSPQCTSAAVPQCVRGPELRWRGGGVEWAALGI